VAVSWEDEHRREEERREASMKSLPACAVRWHAAISPLADGDVLVTASVGPRGEVIALWSTAEGEAALHSRVVAPGGASFATTMTTHPVPVRVTAHSPGPALVAQITDLDVTHPHVQPMPGDRVLIVGARSTWRKTGAERNAAMYDADGRTVAREVLGDGIQHVLATSAGDVWVGYFDEGIYGNFGWGGRGASEPVGACGLVRFSPDLRPAWRAQYEAANRWTEISDVYALNVSDNEVWTCYYTEFPVVRIRDDRRTAWHNEVSGATALAVSGTRVALFGGYGAQASRLCVGVLDGDRLTLTGQYRLTLPGGDPFPHGTRVVGRGAELHFLGGDSWHKLSVDELPH
jgi:hypothetical protein